MHDGRWLVPREALASAARNELTIRFPTQKHLERLARYPDVEAFMQHALLRTVAAVNPYDDGTESFGLPSGPDSW